MGARLWGTDLADQSLGVVEPDHPAVPDVGDGDRAIRPDVRVVGARELTPRRARDSRPAVRPDDPTATENDTYWVAGTTNWTNWTGVGSLGRVGAVRLTADVFNSDLPVR